MPTYEYACKGCGHEFEREQRISDKPIKKCPSCGALKARRQISRTAFVLKGGGWYNDLYATPKGEKASGEEKSSASETKSETKKDATSDTKAETSSGSKGDGGSSGPKKGGKGKKAAA